MRFIFFVFLEIWIYAEAQAIVTFDYVYKSRNLI